MKKLSYLSLLLFISCSTDSNAQEEIIIDYLETSSKDVRTDLKIDISEIEISNVTVADSLAILKDTYQNKIEIEKESIESLKSNIKSAKVENKSLDGSNIDNLAKISANNSLIKLYENGLKKTLLSLKRNQDQKAVALEKYENQDENVVLVKKGLTKFSFFNPKLNTRQERTETFVLSKDGLKVLGMVYKGKLRKKQ